MDRQIVFNTTKEDKQLIDDKARENRLSTSSYCRQIILSKILGEQKNE